MATFAEIIDAVTWELARPDLATRIQYYTVQAVQECHRLGYFAKDLREVTLAQLLDDTPPATPALTWQGDGNVVGLVDLENAVFVIDNWKFRELYKIEVFQDAAMRVLLTDVFKNKAEDALFDEFRRKFSNSYLHMGTQLRIEFGFSPSYANFQYFAVPFDSAGCESSFIVRDYPHIVEAHAIAKLAGIIGDQDVKLAKQRDFPLLHQELYTNEVTVK